MSAPATVASATRRLVALTALRWLPVGLTTPVMVLLASARGLSLAEIGLLFTLHGAARRGARAAHRRARGRARPAGGRARGRRPARPVLPGVRARAERAGASASPSSCWPSGARSTAGRWRPGTSTPSTGSTRGADVAPGLSKHSAADGGGLALGAVAGGLLPGLLGDGGAAALALPYARRGGARPALRRRRPARSWPRPGRRGRAASRPSWRRARGPSRPPSRGPCGCP